jgi:hypothetical protein
MHPRERNTGQRNRTCTKPTVGGLVPEVRMTLEEYLALLESGGVIPAGARSRVEPEQLRQTAMIPVKRKRAGKAAKGMAQAMREANKRLRTKSGKLRKGKTQADVARLAHKIRRKKYA